VPRLVLAGVVDGSRPLSSVWCRADETCGAEQVELLAIACVFVGEPIVFGAEGEGVVLCSGREGIHGYARIAFPGATMREGRVAEAFSSVGGCPFS
jgi:hypothetical protein